VSGGKPKTKRCIPDYWNGKADDPAASRATCLLGATTIKKKHIDSKTSAGNSVVPQLRERHQ